MASGAPGSGIASMHATLGRYDGISGESQDEVIQVGRQLAAVVSKAPGFVSYALLEVGDGTLATVSVFETRAELQAADRLIAAWVAMHRTLLTPAGEGVSGEVLVQRGM